MIVDNILRGFVETVAFFAGTLAIIGQDNIPPKGPYIVVINHMSKADPPLMLITLPKVKLRFFAGEKWQRHVIFSPLLKWGGAVYINRGQVDRKALRQALNALKNGSVFGLAPEGTRSQIGALIKARDGAAYLATRAKVPVLPVGISNTDILGYNMARMKHTNLEIRIGKPFLLPGLDQRPRGSELAAYTHLIMVHIAALLPKRHWGYYADSPALAALLCGQNPWPYCLEAEGLTEEA